MDTQLLFLDCNTFLTYVPIITAFAATIAAFLNFLAIRNLKIQKQSSVIIECATSYSRIKSLKSQAIKECSKEIAEQYYTELIDLFWVEFQIWKQGYISNDIMLQWASVRKKFYKNDSKIEFISKEDSSKVSVKYSDIWESASKDSFNALFIEFLDRIHDGEIRLALKSRKSYKS
jgi:hypothetical protein